jgi:hypothetical protein
MEDGEEVGDGERVGDGEQGWGMVNGRWEMGHTKNMYYTLPHISLFFV